MDHWLGLLMDHWLGLLLSVTFFNILLNLDFHPRVDHMTKL